MNKPDFIVIGASKCGTSTLRTYLAQHPDILMITKEVQFFSCDDIYELGLDWYESLFRTKDSRKIKGEISNLYTMKEVYPNSVTRLFKYAPSVKLIYCVRAPMSRIQSYWLEKRAHGGEEVHYDFNMAVKVNRDCLVDSTNYLQQINAYKEVFPDNQIHVIFFKDFIENPEEVMRQCFLFLGVNKDISLNSDSNSSNLHLGKTDGRLVPRSFLSKLRQYKIFRATVKFIPEVIRNYFKERVFFKKNIGKPVWKSETKEWVANVLKADLAEFLSQYEKPQDFWDFES